MCINPASNGGKWIRREKREAIYKRDRYRCVYCMSKHSLTLDHIRPCSKGGNNRAINLITACRKCNSSRGNRPISVFVKALCLYLNNGTTQAEIKRRIKNQRRKRIYIKND